ncbi:MULTISPECIES: LysR family transcriptional regulator [Pseudomonas]|jgi:DNA-binding transcriptional LysR family regulator|uniref:LysR family transcriptional regulator n=1 Tax=Pseudomonas proteolytica TaxID=219574 RepID=A0AAP6YH30_9PSED|nr:MULTISPECIES: LysR family transcriptional regulator [Pseudomonas]TDR45483.1 LysR family transcriptional regulator [Pseudomonas brenneri]VVO04429.1 HTH-type transcriptional activator CmpR [Pseudomonas fluorescens]KAA8704362.1 LysR family transcriptional regulator [Pseudomonas proteolytica]MCF5060866.1 LysR family transcriptional regulator [Pseudomonas proteolytica]MCF5102729.1 LysR family transcriptional regulator [Pseudomonas proteolytica]
MDLANLNAFIAIAETGSFSGAGERLHLTQPAISKRIAGLEQQLKVRLFDRLGREVGLTEAGRALLPRAYQILNVLDDTRRALTNLTGEVSGRLTLATSHHIGLHRLPPVLRTFTREYPNVALDIQFLDSEVAYEEILHGRAEVAVITLAPEPHSLVRATPVWDDPLDFVVAPEHSLANNGTISLADIARHPAVFPGGNTFTHHIVHRLFEAQGLTPNIAMSTNYLETIKMMVSIGLAWSVLPRTMLDDQVASIALPGIQLSRQLGYIVHTERTLSNAARAFMSLLDAQVDPAGMPA